MPKELLNSLEENHLTHQLGNNLSLINFDQFQTNLDKKKENKRMNYLRNIMMMMKFNKSKKKNQLKNYNKNMLNIKRNLINKNQNKLKIRIKKINNI